MKPADLAKEAASLGLRQDYAESLARNAEECRKRAEAYEAQVAAYWAQQGAKS